MYLRALSVFALSIGILSLPSCAKHYRDTALFDSSGRAKPLVAVLPVIDASGDQQYCWDLAEEFTVEIRKGVADSGEIFLINENGNREIATLFNAPKVDSIPQAALDALGKAQFVVVSELIDSKFLPFGLRSAKESQSHLKEVGAKLNLAMRVRVIDISSKTPKVVLQEVIAHEHSVPRPYLKTDYSVKKWGSAGFQNTPVGQAHNKLVREVVGHVEGYVGAR